jgi:hypothetical protein
VAELSADTRRALQLLARNGCTEAIMTAHGFPSAMPDDLVMAGFSLATFQDMRAGRQPMVVV